MGDIEDLSKKLQDSLNEKNRKNSEDIENYILKRYNWNEIVKETLKLYKEI